MGALKNSKNNKAAGINKIPVDFYKSCIADRTGTSNMAIYITRKLNSMFDKGKIEEEWNTAVLVPIPKRRLKSI